MEQEIDCPFCSPAEGEKVLSSALCYARWDKFPVTEGHLLIIPTRHFADYFSATPDEKLALWDLVEENPLGSDIYVYTFFIINKLHR